MVEFDNGRRQQRWHTLGGFQPEPGSLDMSDHQMALLESSQDEIPFEISQDGGKQGQISRLEVPYWAVDFLHQTSEEFMRDLAQERHVEVRELYDPAKYDHERFYKVVSDTGIDCRDTWKLSDVSEALKSGEADLTLRERVKNIVSAVRIRLGA